jgi:hypothetical protein
MRSESTARSIALRIDGIDVSFERKARAAPASDRPADGPKHSFRAGNRFSFASRSMRWHAIRIVPTGPGKIPQANRCSHFAHSRRPNLPVRQFSWLAGIARLRGNRMKGRFWRWAGLSFAGVLFLALAASASAQVVVTVEGDTASATISLTDDNGTTYDADVTIVFDTPQNLTPQALNLSAEIVDPDEIDPRLRSDGSLPNNNCYLGICPTVDPAFPVMITVEPLSLPWLFASGFDGGDSGSGVFSFLNTYQIDVHTHDLVYADGSPYRLFKAPVGGDFHDVTNDVMPGSVRVRGRGGDFSQFVVANDPRSSTLLGAQFVSLQKVAELDARILAAVLSDGLRLDLLDLLTQVNALLLINLTGAIAALDSLIDLIEIHAGADIANVWSADHSVVNDAGQMDELAKTLRFSLQRQQGAAANP